ncbi:MAG TPA: patatin-like phospholipase family protein [Flavipsychrobacter sp.]|nr:patatin-like phospholipase family protein [Flavipsychrobacter sp.]
MNNNINPGDIRYLSFEGGGGKGAAYMGPFITFLLPSFSVFKVANTTTKERVLNTGAIKGISGASAGAITAALLACNVSLEGTGKMLMNTSLMASFNDTDQDDSFTYAKVPDLSTSPQVYSTNFRQRNQKLRAIMTGIQFLTPYLPSLITYPTVENILADWGLAPGFQIRRFMDDMMTQGMYDGYRRKKNTRHHLQRAL